MAKKEKNNKSAEVRRLLAKSPSMSVAQIAKTAKVTPALVYNVRSAMKTKSKTSAPKTTKTKTTSKRGARKNAASEASLPRLILAAKFVKECGGVDAALQAVKAVGQVVDAVQA